MPTRGTALSLGNFVELECAVLKALPRDIDPDVAANWARNGESLTRVLREALMPPEQRNATTTYPVSVNYDTTVEEMVRLGHYDWSNSDVTSKHFPTKRTGTADLVIELVHVNRDISTKDAQKELDRMGFRPAELHELLAFGAKYPEVQREFPILALGSVWQDLDDDRRYACLHGVGSERGLYLRWFGGDWDDVCRFAAVRK